MELQNIRKSGIYNHDKKINDQFQHVARLGHIVLGPVVSKAFSLNGG